MEVSGRRANKGSEDNIEVCTPCHGRGKRLEVQGYCRQCKEYLCTRCYDCHTVPSAMAHHELVDKSKMPRGQSSITPTATVTCTEPCAKHAGKIIEFICVKHNQLACNVCVSLEHPGCKGSISYIPEVAHNVNKSQEYKGLMKQIQDLRTATKNVNVQVESDMKISESEGNEAIAEMMKLKKELNTFIDKIVGNMQRKVDTVKEKNKAALEYRKGSCSSIISAVDQLETEIKAKHKQEADLFIRIKRGQTQLDTMREELDTFDKDEGIRRYKFVPNVKITAVMTDPKLELGSLEATGQQQQSKRMQVAKQTSTKGALSQTQCVECKGNVDSYKTLPCSHVMCWTCLDRKEKNRVKCPACGLITGNQPDGTMEVFEGRRGCIDIHYQFADGVQGRDHPRPGAPYRRMEMVARLWLDEEGKKLRDRLRTAFNRKMLFTVSDSGTVVQNGIEHLTSRLTYYPNKYQQCVTSMQTALTAMGVPQ